MLISRVITALFLLPLAISGILYLPTSYFALVMGIIFVIGGYEWTKISAIPSSYNFTFIGSIVVLMAGCWFISFEGRYLIYLSVLFWVISIFFISQFPRYQSLWSTSLLVKYVVGYLVIIPSWYALILLKNLDFIQLLNTQITGSQLVLIMMIMIWCADTGAYFSGRQWGRQTLIPNVSPGKTRAGVYGAIASTSLLLMIFNYFFISESPIYLLASLVFATLIVIVSVIGDLFESMYKRNSGIKDSGHILPGHGGILDRIDSLTSVAPVFYTLIYFISDVNVPGLLL